MADHSAVFVWIPVDEAETAECLVELIRAWPDVGDRAASLMASTGSAIGVLEGLVASGDFRRIKEVEGDERWHFEAERRLAYRRTSRE